MAKRKEDNKIGCPSCGSLKLTVLTVKEPEVDGWNKPIQKLTMKCRCGHIFERQVHV